MIAWFVRNSVAANLLMVTIILGGLLAMKTELTLEVFPDAEPDTISVFVPLRGATPEDVELGIATRIEESVKDLEGVDKIISTSREGSTSVLIEVDEGADPREILDDVKSRVDAINTFPADAEKPVISLATRTYGVIDLVVSGPYSEAEIIGFAESVREDLLRTGKITQADLSAVRKYEIAVEASQDRLREFNLTLGDLSSAIRRSSVDISAGNLRAAGGDVLIRSKGQAYRRDDFESIVVKTNPDGSIISLRDVARVDDGFEEDALSSRFNGRNAAFVQISRVGDQSALEIAELVHAYIEKRQATLPSGMSLSYWDDDAQYLKDRLGILLDSAVMGTFLVILLLTLFLRPSVAIWVFVGIPVSFLGAILVMGLLDIPLNVMSAFAFIVVLGIVVDDAIVTGESVYTHLQSAESGSDAAINGTREVAIPVTFGVLTTMVAFSPLLFIEGRLGDVFAPIPAVVVPVLLFSLIESKFVLPAHLQHVKLRGGSKRFATFSTWQQNFADGFERAILRYYRPLLKHCTNHRYLTLASFVGVFVLILALISSGWTRFVFFPKIEGQTATANLQMPVGTPFEVTDAYIRQIADAASQLQEKYRDPETGESIVLNVLSVTGAGFGRGSSGSHLGRVQFEMTPPEQRSSDLKPSTLAGEWRKIVGVLPGAETLSFRAQRFSAGDPVNIQLSGNSLERLSEVGDKVKAKLGTYTTVYEISDSLSDGKEELRIELKPAGHILGLTRADVVNQVGNAFKGLQAQRIQRGRDDIRVLVRFPQGERRTIDTLNEMLISAPAGVQVPLSHVATLSPGRGPSAIKRIDGYRVLNVTAEIDKEKTNAVVLNAELVNYLDQLLLLYPDILYTMEGEAEAQRDSFGSLQSGLIAVVFVIYCLLALPLRSYVQPLIIMSVIPFGIIGAVIGHWIMGRDLSILSIHGMLALVGVLVNDSLVLVDYINKRRSTGLALRDAVLLAGVTRFRPVFLTSLTTFFGLAPLMFEKSVSAQFLIPMAISLGFGILFATFVTLLLVPTNILIANDIRQLFKRAPEPAVSQN